MKNNPLDIRTLSSDQLDQLVIQSDQPKFRARQIEEWVWKKGVLSFEEMSNIPKALRTHLEEHYQFYPMRLDSRQTSSDGTIKLRFEVQGGHFIESVLIPVTRDQRYTVCVSSQAGCSLNCSFCATGKMGLLRQLTTAEIVDQVRAVQEICQDFYGKNLTNIVFMGMGEPLLNYRNVKESIHRLTNTVGLGFSSKRITISTAGIAKLIKKMADDGLRVNLALSLHAANDIKRNKIMPINESNNLASLTDAITYFYSITKNRISFEYIALRDVNDSIEDAVDLVRLASHFPVRINIIEYNPIGDGLFSASDQNKLDKFILYLTKRKVVATIRRSRGKDIDAACGQLANKA